MKLPSKKSLGTWILVYYTVISMCYHQREAVLKLSGYTKRKTPLGDTQKRKVTESKYTTSHIQQIMRKDNIERKEQKNYTTVINNKIPLASS